MRLSAIASVVAAKRRSVVPTGYKDLILSKSPLMYLRGGYTDTSGLLRIPDASGNGLWGSFSAKYGGSPVNIVPGVSDGIAWGKSMTGGGTSGSRIDLQADARLTGLSRNFTLEQWVKFEGSSSDGSIIAQLSSSGGFSVYTGPGYTPLYFGASNVSNDGAFSPGFTADSLYKIDVVVDPSGGVSVLANSMLLYSTTTSVNYAVAGDGAYGSNRSGANNFVGWMQELAVYAAALTQKSLSENYLEGVGTNVFFDSGFSSPDLVISSGTSLSRNSSGSGSYRSAFVSQPGDLSKDLLYAEFPISTTSGISSIILGLREAKSIPSSYNTYLGADANACGIDSDGSFYYAGNQYLQGWPQAVAGDYHCLAMQRSTGKVWFGRNNNWEAGSDPATFTNPSINFGKDLSNWRIGVSMAISGQSGTLRANSATIVGTPPAGYSAFQA